MDLFFGLPYCTGDQERFQKALDERELEEAIDILEKLPHANIGRIEEQILRNSFLAIGYREIVRKFMPQDTDIRVVLKEHAQYMKFGTPSEVEMMAKEHKEYQELGEVNELKRIVHAEERLFELEASLVRVPVI